MIRLLGSELWRLASRRLFRVLGLSVLGLTVLVGVMVFWRTGGVGQQLRYASAAPFSFLIAAQPLFSLSVVAGASFVGAEWTNGTMATLLTWEPRRGRVLVSKLLAVASTVFLATLVILAFLALVLLPSAVAHGSTAGLSGSWWWSLAGLWLRAGALSAVGAALGVGLAGLFRSSAGAIATWLIFEFLVAQLIVLWRPSLFRWMPGANVQRLLSAQDVVGVTVNGQDLLGMSSAVRAGIVLGAYAAALVGASYAALRSRDVT